MSLQNGVREVGVVFCHLSAHRPQCPPHRIFALVSSRGGVGEQNLNGEGLLFLLTLLMAS